MKSDDTSMKEKIIDAALQCIERDGIQGITIRAIAQEAKVNSAAINYYFGSKERLMEELFRSSLDNAFSDLNDYIDGKNDSQLYETMKVFFIDWINGITVYPNISKAQLYDPLYNNHYSDDLLKKFNSFLNQLYPVMKKIMPGKGKAAISMAMIQIISAVILPVLLPGLWGGYAGIDFKNPQYRREYVENLLKHYL